MSGNVVKSLFSSKTGAIALTGLILITVGGTFAYYRSQKTERDVSNETGLTPTPEKSSLETSLITGEYIVPAGWTMNTSSDCKVTFPLPPHQDPYSSAKTDGTKVLWSSNTASSFGNSTSVYYPAASASGVTISIFLGDSANSSLAHVTLWCAENISQLTTGTFAEEWIKQFKSVQGNTLIDQVDSAIWNVKDTVIKVQEKGVSKEYHLLATPSRLYIVNSDISEQKILSQNTLAIIFRNLKFE